MTSTFKKWPVLGLLKPEFTSKIRMFVIFGNFGYSCLIVTKDQMVYSVGNNSGKYLRTVGPKYSVCPMKIDKLCGQNIKTFAYSQGHVLALTENGEVYTWGSNDHLQLGYSGGSSVPQKVQIMQNETTFVVDIACGAYHSLALTNNGKVYAWGKETTNDSHYFHYPVQHTSNGIRYMNIGILIKCVSISCGSYHSMALTNNGEIYGWGENSSGQLGNGNTNRSRTPIKVNNLNEIVIAKVVCGMNHTLALSNKGCLYSWGDNKLGQLGIVLRSGNNSTLPMAISELKHVLDMAASNNSNISVAMGVGHQIFMWGQCSGQSVTCPILTSIDSIHDVFALHASPRNMHEPLVISDDTDNNGKNATKRLLDNLETAFDDKNTSDLTIEVEGKPIYVHKTILRIRSEYFKSMFEGSWKENNDSVIKEDQFCYVVYRAFLKFLYTGKIDIPEENAVELLQLANFYNEDNLKASCVDVIIEDISTTNAAFLYGKAMQYNAMALKDCCMKFAVKNMTHIVKSTSFAELSQEEMKTFIIEADKFGVFKM